MKKTNSLFVKVSFIALILCSSISFSNAQTPTPLPIISAYPVSSITETSAIVGADVINTPGSRYVVYKGFCWSTSPNPTINNNSYRGSGGSVKYTAQITGLNLSTTYYLRAYAYTEGDLVAYGPEISFKTKPTSYLTLPQASTGNLTVLSTTSNHQLKIESTVLSEGSSPVTVRGICWSTSPNFKIEDPNGYYKLTSVGNGLGSFTSQISLDPGYVYYIKTYAYSAAGIAYGNEIEYTTVPKVPTIETQTYTSQFTLGLSSGIDKGNNYAYIDYTYMPKIKPGDPTKGKFNCHLQITNNLGTNAVIGFYLSDDSKLDNKDELIEKMTLNIPKYTDVYNFTIPVFTDKAGTRKVMVEILTEQENIQRRDIDYQNRFVIRNGTHIGCIGGIVVDFNLRSGSTELGAEDNLSVLNEEDIFSEVTCQLIDQKYTIRVNVPSQYIGGNIIISDIYGSNFKQIEITKNEMYIPNQWKSSSKFIVIKVINKKNSSTFKFAN